MANTKVTSRVLADDAVLTANIADDAVTSAKLDTNITVAGTLASTGALTANAGVVVDNITIDGTEIDLSSGDLLVDVAGDIYLDAAGAEIYFSASGGTGSTVGYLSMAANNLTLKSGVSDADIIFQGNDGGSAITALTLDMSNAGHAVFGHTVAAKGYITNGNSGVQGFQLGIDGATDSLSGRLFLLKQTVVGRFLIQMKACHSIMAELMVLHQEHKRLI